MELRGLDAVTVQRLAQGIGVKVTGIRERFDWYSGHRTAFTLRPLAKYHYRRVDVSRYRRTGRITRSNHLCWHGYRQFITKAVAAGVWTFTHTPYGRLDFRHHRATAHRRMDNFGSRTVEGAGGFAIREFCFCNPAMRQLLSAQQARDTYQRAAARRGLGQSWDGALAVPTTTTDAFVVNMEYGVSVELPTEPPLTTSEGSSDNYRRTRTFAR